MSRCLSGRPMSSKAISSLGDTCAIWFHFCDQNFFAASSFFCWASAACSASHRFLSCVIRMLKCHLRFHPCQSSLPSVNVQRFESLPGPPLLGPLHASSPLRPSRHSEELFPVAVVALHKFPRA